VTSGFHATIDSMSSQNPLHRLAPEKRKRSHAPPPPSPIPRYPNWICSKRPRRDTPEPPAPAIGDACERFSCGHSHATGGHNNRAWIVIELQLWCKLYQHQGYLKNKNNELQN
jgi:hypothetical protein